MDNPLDAYRKTFKVYGLESDLHIKMIYEAWNEEHRHWHSYTSHLLYLLERIERDKKDLSLPLYQALVMTSIFHNIVFDPKSRDRYDKSADVFEVLCPNTDAPYYDDIVATIMALKYDNFEINELAIFFHEYDRNILMRPMNFRRLVEYEKKIFLENKYLDFKRYRTKRLAWLEKWRNKNPDFESTASQLMEYVRSFHPKIGVYVGSFDPFHKGHYSVLKKSEKLFDKVIIAIGINPKKEGQKQVTNRLARIRECLPYHQIESFEGFFTDFLKELGYETTVIRGIRNTSDLNAEIALQRTFEDLYPEINIVYFFSDHSVQHISSTRARNFSIIKPGSEKIYTIEPQKSIYDKLYLGDSEELDTKYEN